MESDHNDKFIQKAKAVHGNKYDYSKVEYIGNRFKVIITCPEHGDFLQKAGNHLNGCGCKGCFKQRNKSNINEFITRANIVHNNKYNYSKVVYNGAETKVTIICPIHGEFEQIPMSHVKGHGCNLCRHEYIKANSRDTLEEFLEKAKQSHGDKFNYDKVNYVNSVTKVLITCPEHGDFLQRPSFHIKGNGCQLCYGNKKYTNEEFIEKCNLVHKGYYDYSKVVYKGNKLKVKIICPVHGEFEQIAQDHLKGFGCLRCKESKGERFIADVLEKANINFIREYKLPHYQYKYDFYLPDENIFIEFHGSQHYYPVDFFGGEEALARTKERDAFKRSLAHEYRIPLIEFNFRHAATLTPEEFERAIVESISRERKLKARRLA